MRILNSDEWEFVGVFEDGFMFKNTKYPQSNERLIISVVGLACLGTRIYFEFIDGEPKIRVPKREAITASLVSNLFKPSMLDLVETESSYYGTLIG